MGTIQIIVYVIVGLLALRYAVKVAKGESFKTKIKIPNLKFWKSDKTEKTEPASEKKKDKTEKKPVLDPQTKVALKYIFGAIIIGIGIWFLWPRIQSFRHPQEVAFKGQVYDTTLVMNPHSKLSRTVPPNYGITVDAPNDVITSNNSGESYVTGAKHIGSIITVENKGNRKVSVRLLYKPM